MKKNERFVDQSIGLVVFEWWRTPTGVVGGSAGWVGCFWERMREGRKEREMNQKEKGNREKESARIVGKGSWE